MSTAASVRRRLSSPAGFTLVELLIVVLVIGILVAVSAPSFLGQAHKATDSAAQQYLTIAYREAATSTVDHEGNFGGTVDGPTTRQTVADAINQGEAGLLFAEPGTCPADATSDPKHIVVSQAAGGDLTLCNAVPDSGQHTVWTLTVVNHALEPLTAETDPGTGIGAPRVASYPSLSSSGSTSHVQVGDVLHVANGSWVNDPTGFSYQWQHSSDGGSTWSSATGAGASSSDYTVDPSDLGDYLRAVVTGSNAGGDRAVATTAVGPVLPATPLNDANNPPTISDAQNALSHVQVGDALTADPGQWSDCASCAYSYTWQRSVDASFSSPTDVGSDSTDYTVVGADEGHYLRVVVQATNSGGTSSASSDPAGAVLPHSPVNGTQPLISDADHAPTSAQIGDHLSVDSGSWSDCTGCAYSYTWQRGVDAGFSSYVNVGSDSSSYTVQTADVGKYLRVSVEATNSGGQAAAFSSNQTGQIPAYNSAPPTFSGTVQVGQTLTATSGSWTGAGNAYAYQWEHSSDGSTWTNAAGAGASSSSYTVASSDYGLLLRVCVTASNDGGSAEACSGASSSTASPAVPVNTAQPTISDDNGSSPFQVGDPLTADPGTWSSPDEAISGYSYTWQTSPDGSTWTTVSSGSAHYTVQQADLNDYIRISVQASNSGGNSTAATSIAYGPIVAAVPVGTVIAYAGATTPSGWLPADGAAVSRSAYPALYAAIGTSYGAGDGSTTFNVPNLAGRLPIGKTASGTGSAPTSAAGSLGQSGTASLGSFAYSFSWTDSISSPFSFFNHGFTGSSTFTKYRYNGSGAEQTDCTCSNGRTSISYGAASDTATVAAQPTGTATGTATVSAAYTAQAPPYRALRYLISAQSTATLSPCLIWPSAATSAPAGTIAAGSAASGDVGGCLDGAYGGSTPDLTGRYPVGLTASGAGSSLNASGGALSQTASVVLDTASTQASVTLSSPLSASINVTAGSHSVSLGGADAYWRGDISGANSGPSGTEIFSNTGTSNTSSSTTSSPTFGAGSGKSNAASPQTVTSASWSAPFRVVDYRLYATSGYSPAAGTMIASATSSAPAGWLKADGSCYQTTDYPNLYAAIGTTYGGSGSNFCLPQMSGRSPIGRDTSNGSLAAIGATGGSLDATPAALFSGWTPTLTVDGHTFNWSVADDQLRVSISSNNSVCCSSHSGGTQGTEISGGTWTTNYANSGTTSPSSVTTSQTVTSRSVNAASAVSAPTATLPAQNPDYEPLTYLIKY